MLRASESPETQLDEHDPEVEALSRPTEVPSCSTPAASRGGPYSPAGLPPSSHDQRVGLRAFGSYMRHPRASSHVALDDDLCATATELLDLPEITQAAHLRMFLPGRDGGLGLQSTKAVAPAALVAAWHQHLPQVAARLGRDSRLSISRLSPGPLPLLAAAADAVSLAVPLTQRSLCQEAQGRVQASPALLYAGDSSAQAAVHKDQEPLRRCPSAPATHLSSWR